MNQYEMMQEEYQIEQDEREQEMSDYRKMWEKEDRDIRSECQ